MANRPTAPDRMRRVLAVIPWIVANPGQPVRTVAARFGLTERELLDDLNVVYLVGLPPYSPDALIDVDIDDEGGVTIRLADFFSRPLRLTPAQGLALLASSDGLLSVPGTEPDGALARALQKLGASLGVGRPDDALDVHLGDAEARVLDQLRRAAADGTEVDITYYSYGRDERGARTVTPWRVFAEAGAWYLHAWCSRAGDERVFRVDRIEHLEPRATPSAHPAPRPEADEGNPGPAGPVVFQPRHDDPRVRLRLSPEAAWVIDAYPAEVLERSDDGHVVAELVVTAVPWLERLLLRLGSEAEVVGQEGLPEAGELAARAANRILQRYRLG